jgi:hypothetical protein
VYASGPFLLTTTVINSLFLKVPFALGILLKSSDAGSFFLRDRLSDFMPDVDDDGVSGWYARPLPLFFFG